MMVHINAVFAEVCNIHISDEAANLMIEEAAISAAAQVREECHRRRLAEKHNATIKAENDIEQQRELANTRAWREKEAELSRQRTEELRRAEAMPPVPPRRFTNSGW